MDLAAGFGHLDIIKFLHKNHPKVIVYFLDQQMAVATIDEAASWGLLEIVKYLHELGDIKCNKRAIENAVNCENFTIVKFLLTHRNERLTSQTIYIAAVANHKDILNEKVLTDFELIKIIVSYQEGIYEDIRCWFGNGEMAIKWLTLALEYPFPPTDIMERKIEYFSPLGLAVLSGNLAAVGSIIKCKPHLSCSDIVEYALGVQQTQIASYLLQQQNSNLKLVYSIHCRALRPYWTIDTSYDFFLSVIREDNEELLKLLIVFFNGKYDGVIVGSFVSVLQSRFYKCALVLYELYHDEILSQNIDLVRIAIKSGHLDLIIRLHNENATFTSDTMNVAASYGHLNIVQYLHENCSEGCTTRAMDKAAANNHLHVLKFLHANRSEGCTPDALINAVRFNNLEIVEFLLSNRPEAFTPDALFEAVECNRLTIFNCLLDSNMFEFSVRAFDQALSKDQGDFVLCYIQAFPQQIAVDTLVPKALEYARFKVAYELVNAGYPLKLPNNMRWCILHPEALELFQWLVSHGIELHPLWMDLAASFGTLELVIFFHEKCTAGCTTDAIDGAAKKNYIAIVQFLIENRSEGCTEAAFKSAVRNRSPTLFKLLLENYPEKCSDSVAADAIKLSWS
ncbi:hypothetical protein THRCLA_22928 [Thraustotheca clavata]|uniref:Uncharacterized protein n=1 Tax=Thraustotheca clavata TaxID=74557 RepID=A0A1V9YN57_9STRA|nr:hypothetical protein THRCLA_22928 [Thraustotheca clavata]